MLDIALFFPTFFLITQMFFCQEALSIELISCQETSKCPKCGNSSGKIHSHYERKPRDLPMFGITVYLKLICRKFFCKNLECERKIFTERFADFIKSYARNTRRLGNCLTKVAFATNAETGSKLSNHLAVPVSPDTVLNIVRKTEIVSNDKPTKIGIDEWAKKKGRNYGTIICDIETHRVIELLETDKREDVENWLAKNQQIEIVCRDRSNSFAKAINNQLPHAIQIADRFHLVKNLLDALIEYVKRTFSPSINIGFEKKEDPNPKLCLQKKNQITKIEKARAQGRQKKIETIRQVKKYYAQGMSVRTIEKNMHIARQTIKRYLKLEEKQAATYNLIKPKPNMLNQYKDVICQQASDGKKASNIFRYLQTLGYKGCESSIRHFVAKLKKQGEITIVEKNKSIEIKSEPQKKKKWLKRNKLITYLWTLEADINNEGKRELEHLLKKFPIIENVYKIVQGFRNIMLEKDVKQLEIWIVNSYQSKIDEIIRFAKGLKRDWHEVQNAFVYPYSNGVTEGQVNRLKMFKRMMFGRGKVDLLKQRLLYKF